MIPPVDHSALIEALIERLCASYPFPDRAARAAGRVRAELANGSYALPLGPDLCERISADLFQACNDKHLRLLWHESLQESEDEATLVAALAELFRLENQGLRRVERLAGEPRPDRADGDPAARGGRRRDRRGDAARRAHAGAHHRRARHTRRQPRRRRVPVQLPLPGRGRASGRHRRRAGRAGAPVLDVGLPARPAVSRSARLRPDERRHVLGRRGARLQPAGAGTGDDRRARSPAAAPTRRRSSR